MGNCTSPLYRVPVGSLNFTKLPDFERNRAKNDGVFINYSDISLYNLVEDGVQTIPCGQCLTCRLRRSYDWAVRCSLEASTHKFNYFVTLTYDDYFMPRGHYIDYSGAIHDSTLCRSDVQKFLKNLREYERVVNGNTGIRVFYSGEYGGLTSRPHYHLILMGVSEIPDLTYRCTRGSYKYYKSRLYESFWSKRISGFPVLKGFVDICEVSFDNIAYTARYCLKKINGVQKKDFLASYENIDVEDRPDLRVQEFVGMSNRPGIAYDYWVNNRLQITAEDRVKYQRKFQLFKSKPPRYFDKLFEREDCQGFEKMKSKRRMLGRSLARIKSLLISEDKINRNRREERMSKDKEQKRVRGL